MYSIHKGGLGYAHHIAPPGLVVVGRGGSVGQEACQERAHKVARRLMRHQRGHEALQPGAPPLNKLGLELAWARPCGGRGGEVGGEDGGPLNAQCTQRNATQRNAPRIFFSGSGGRAVRRAGYCLKTTRASAAKSV